MGMTADDQFYVQPFEDRQQAVFGGPPGEHLAVASRRGMAEEHRARPGYVESERLRPARQQSLVLGIELLRDPADDFPKRRGHGPRLRLRASQPREHLALAVPADEPNRKIEVQQGRDRLPRHRPRNHIAPHDDLVDSVAMDLLEDGLESGEVPMNVVDGGDPHGRLPRSSRPRHGGAAQIQRPRAIAVAANTMSTTRIA
jgi:hypothetical protein